MELQVLVSTMHQTDHALIEKMKIKSNAIIINQCEKNEFEEFEYNGHKIKFLSFAERGVGLSRNNALMRATDDICLFADDDVAYVDNYADIIVQEFLHNPKADIIIFNVLSTNSSREEYINKNNKRLRLFNCLKYGTVRIAVKTNSIRIANVSFSLLFGGGAKYSAGEDSLFLADCLNKGLKIYASSKIIGTTTNIESTWFKGYTDKYFIDKGVFFAFLSKKWAKILSLQFVLRHHKIFKKEKSCIAAYRLMCLGIKEVNR